MQPTHSDRYTLAALAPGSGAVIATGTSLDIEGWVRWAERAPPGGALFVVIDRLGVYRPLLGGRADRALTCAFPRGPLPGAEAPLRRAA